MNKWTFRYLQLAKGIANWSKDPSTQVGCIAVKDKTILSQGFNGLPRGIRDLDSRLTDRDTKYKLVVHAEMNAIYNACLNGVGLEGANLYVYGLPVCSECAKGIIQVGIKKVVMQHSDTLLEKWKDSFALTEEMFREAEIYYLRFNQDNLLIED